MSRVPRRAEPRISDPKTYPHETVCLTVAAHFCSMDRRALNAYIDEGHLAYEWKGRRRRVRVEDVVRFKAWLRARAQAS